MRPGVTFASLMNLGPTLGVEIASEAAGLGDSSYWTAETTGPEAFSFLSAVGAAAPGLDLGTGVLALQLRDPMLTAMSAATLQALHPDREILVGIGVSSPVVTESWHGVEYGTRPLARVREFVHVLRACWSGDAVTHDGDFYRLKRSRLGLRQGDRTPKVVIGALNPQMLRLAGEIADGVLLNYLPSSHVAWSVEQVRAGGDATIYAYIHAGVAERTDDTVARAQRDLFSYVVVDAYARNFERAGFADDVAAVRRAHADRDRDGALAGVSDRFVDAIDFVGSETDVASFAAAYVDAGVEVPVLMPLPWGDDRRRVVSDTMHAFLDGVR